MAWTAQVSITSFDSSDDRKIWHNVEVRTLADSEDEAKEAASKVTNWIAGGRLAFFRARPEGASDRDFFTATRINWGYARFSVFDEAGEWHDSPSSLAVPFASVSRDL